jgi:Sec-independent protein translocase protein TatA
MDSILGIGLPELIVVLLLAGLVMGPQRIRQVARTLGRITAQLQSISRQFARQLNAELDALDDGDLRGSLQDLRALQDEVKSLRQELGQAPRSVIAEGRAAVEEGRQALEGKPVGASSGPNQGKGQDPTPEPSAGGKVDGGAATGDAPPLPRLIEIPDDPE